MAMTKAYLKYLNQHIEIAPANSQEEVEAASVIESVLRSQTGLSVEKHDIAGPAEINFVYGILGVVFFLGVVLSGLGGLVCALLGLLFAALGFVFLLLRYLNLDILSHTLPVGRSQNLVAHHKGYGPHSGHGTRPIVVMAHYDTGKEEFLYNPSIARYSSVLFTIAPIATAVAALCCLLQIFLFLPDVFLRVVWVIGLLAALPALIWAINNIAAKFMPLSGAANDNNASVAALLGVVEDVCVSDPSKRAERRATLLEVAAKEAEEARELGLEGFADVSNTILPEEKAAENNNPVKPADEAALQSSPESTAALAEDALKTLEESEKAADEELPVETENDVKVEIAAKKTEASKSADPEPTPGEKREEWGEIPAKEDQNNAEQYSLDANTQDRSATTLTPQEAPEAIPEFTAVRHGADVIKKMGILPDYCDLEYVEELALESASEANAPNSQNVEILEYEGAEGLPLDGEHDENYSQEGARSSSRRSRRRTNAQPQTPLEKVQSFFASIPSPADILSNIKGKQSADENRRERGRRGHAHIAKSSQELVSGETSEVLASEMIAQETKIQDLEQGTGERTQNVQEIAEQAETAVVLENQTQGLSQEGASAEAQKTQVVSNTTESVLDAEISQALKKAELSEAKEEEKAPAQTVQNDADQSSHDETPQTDSSESPHKEVGDPLWGTSSFEPINDNKNVAKRAALFDLPDPSVATVDPLSEDFQIQHTGEIDPRDFPVEEFGAVPAASTKDIPTPSAASFEVLHEDRTQISSDDVKDGGHKRAEKPGPWKGGGTFSEAAREDKDADDPEKQTELEEAVLDMDYVDLVSHDIWFVLTGGSGLDHAGAKTFFREHKKDLRGACVINLEAVGAGELTALTEEGFGFNKKADHRMLRFFKSISRDVHIPLLREKRVWADTEATIAMREKLRSVTLMGTDPGQIPALAHTDQNVPENVDQNQVAQANMIVSELIRRL